MQRRRVRREQEDVRDEAWFEALYRAHHGAVLAYARRRGEDADDVVAEVFTTAWRQRHRVPEPALPWLLRVAHNHLLHAHRAAARRRRLLGRARLLLTETPDHADRVVVSDSVLVALGQLGPRDREILRLSAWEDLDPAGIAVVLGCTPGAARVRLHRARRRLEALLTPVPDLEQQP